MNRILRLAAKGALVALLATSPAFLTACDDDEEVVYSINADASQLVKTVAWDETETSVTFHATANWTAVADKSSSWITITVPTGEAGDVKMPASSHKMMRRRHAKASSPSTAVIRS